MTHFPPAATAEPPAGASLEVRLLGCVDFDSVLFLQERLAYELSGRDDLQGALLMCEHPPIVTVGREGSRNDILADPHELVSRQMEVRWLNRGGGCLVHAPGQLAVYPVLPLDRLGLGLCDYCRLLEECVIAASGELRVPAWRFEDEPGVWCRLGQFAHVGVAVRSWVAWHGLFVNVSPPLDLMRLVQSGGSGERVTSLSAQRERFTPMHAVRESLIRQFVERLGYQRFHVYTGHPLLRRTRKTVSIATA
jgi:lipoyl(octanoyl) transferase